MALHFIDTVVYAPDAKKMTRNDKKEFVHKTQAQIIQTYTETFEHEKHPYIELDGTLGLKAMTGLLQRKVVDVIV